MSTRHPERRLLTFTAAGGSTGNYSWGGTSGATGAGTTKSVTFNTVGTFTVTIQDTGNTNYNGSNTATATITVNPLYNSVLWNSFSAPAPVYVSTTAGAPASWQNNGTKPWGANHLVAIRDASYNAVALISTNGTATGATGSGTFTWTATSTPGTYTYYYCGLESGVEWFNATGSFTMNIASNPTVGLTADAMTLLVGQTTTIRSTYSVDTTHADSLVQTAINWNPGTGEANVSLGTGNLT